jgi:hypothetical protein
MVDVFLTHIIIAKLKLEKVNLGIEIMSPFPFPRILL